MGRIKSTLIKRTAEKLLDKMPDAFTPDFDEDKKVISEVMPSKRIRNMVAGYIARLKKLHSK